MTLLITGGAGFIGSNFVHKWFENYDETIINLDILNYAASLQNLEKFRNKTNHIFIKGNICEEKIIRNILENYKPRAIINFAAQTHVDRSISSPTDFVKSNILGTFNLLECVRNYLDKYQNIKKDFKFIQISTDEVYGSLKKSEFGFTEKSQFNPNSPYSATKASSDHLVRSYNKTFNLPTIVTHCSNNYGPYQYPEKLIPLVINNALKHKPIPLYGDGSQVRDWIYVEDHCNAILKILNNSKTGLTYNIGADNEITNNTMVQYICEILDKINPIPRNSKIKKYKDLVIYVKDRPGHDQRYSINANKIKTELNWSPKESLKSGLIKTINWYLNNIIV